VDFLAFVVTPELPTALEEVRAITLDKAALSMFVNALCTDAER
jgi:hypothetical protein